MKRIFVFFVILLSYPAVNGQNKITGRITDQDNKPLIGATVFINELSKGTVSGTGGAYELLNLPNGKVKIQFSFVGYKNRIETAELNGNQVNLDISLEKTAIEAEEIVISSGYSSTQHENAVKIDVLKLEMEGTKSTPNFTEVLTKVPGVDMISKGSGISKPVIRGLSMNDILILNNGVRFENYQYSSHHPLGIDEFGIDDVEIIKGPASLLYGSDAIGGVINFIKEKPAPIGTLIGDYNLQLFSNTLGVTNNVGIKGASKKFYGGLRAGQKSNADFLQGGGDYVPNSRFNEISVKADAGFTDKIGSFKLIYSFNNQELGLVEDEAITEIKERGRKNEIFYQELNTHLLSNQNRLYLGNYKLDFNIAYQNTELIHFGEIDVYEIQMQLATLTYDIKLHLPSADESEYVIGFQGFNQKNKNLNDREVKLLPDATTNNYSAFGLMQFKVLRGLMLQAGIRYDNKSISTLAIGETSDTSAYRAPLRKSFGSFSGSFGAICNLSEDLLLRANFAAAYRTPNLAELTSNGQHELRFEKGDQNLVPENAYEADLSLHYHKNNFTADIAGFFNTVNNYIFIAPTGETTSSGIPVFRYRQSNATLFGGEAGIHIHPEALKWLHSEATFSSVTGKQQNGDYLPFVPAHKLRLELRGEKEKLLHLYKAFVSINCNTAFDQNNAAPDETTTPGYTLFDIGIGASLMVQNQEISFKVSVNNLLDKKYIDHLSTLKEVNLNNAGRNITFSIRIPFGIAGQTM